MCRNSRKNTSDVTITKFTITGEGSVAVFRLIIVVLVTTWGTDVRSRAVVCIDCRGEVTSRCRNGNIISISTRVAGSTCRLISTCKHNDTAVNHAIWRTCIMDKIVQSLLFQNIIRCPFIICRKLRSPIVWVCRT